MICTDAGYCRALQWLDQKSGAPRAQLDHLSGLGLAPEEVERAMQPLLSFRSQLAEEVEACSRMRRGDLDPLKSFTAIGRGLVSVRIARGLSQVALADRLGVDEFQVSRDERNGCRGVTTEREKRILEALDVRFTAQAESLLCGDVPKEFA